MMKDKERDKTDRQTSVCRGGIVRVCVCVCVWTYTCVHVVAVYKSAREEK